MPEISIIVPIYKTEKYLNRCVNSLINQTFKNFELILVDDGSPDACPVLCDKWGKRDTRIKVIHKKNGGLSSARNAGLNIAQGKYIGFVDSDDWIEPDMYELLYNAAEKYQTDYSAVNMLITKKEQVSIYQPTYNEVVYDREQLFEIFFRIVTDDIKYCVCDKLYRSEIILDTRFKEGIRFEDIDFNFRILQKCRKAVLINQIKYYYFYNEEGITRNAVIPEDLQLLKVWNNIEKICRMEYPNYTYYAHMNYNRSHMGLLGKYVKFGVSKNFSNWKYEKRKLLNYVRKNFIALYRWKMPRTRKLLLIAICINPDLIAIPFRLTRKRI